MVIEARVTDCDALLAEHEAGLGSGKTYEAAKKVVETGAPELVQAMDSQDED